MKQLLNIIIFMMIGGFIGAWVQMAISYQTQDRQAGIQLYSVVEQQAELVRRGHDIKVDGRFGKNTDLALTIEITKGK
jgi:hypothetical protein